jgi:riboflavin-specific deaminase-like protein
VRPFVTANFAITADGRISTRKGTPANFTSPRDKRRLIEIRAECDAVLAGVRTIATDNMTMGLPAEDLRTAREARGLSAEPIRVLLSNSGRIDPGLRVFTRGTAPIVIFSTTRMPRQTRAALEKKAALYLDEKAVDLDHMLRRLRREHGVKRLVCEGGARVFRALLAEDLIDELHVTLAPRIFGGVKAPTLTGLAGEYLSRSTHLRLREMEVIEDECFLRYRAMRKSQE